MDNADEHGSRKSGQDETVRLEPRGMGQIDDAQPIQELGRRVAGEGDETPEDERVRKAGDGSLGDRLPLTDDVHEKTSDAEADAVDGKRVGRGSNQADAC